MRNGVRLISRRPCRVGSDFDVAQTWLDNKRAEQSAQERSNTNHVSVTVDSGSNLGARAVTPQEEALYQEFLKWKQLRQNNP